MNNHAMRSTFRFLQRVAVIFVICLGVHVLHDAVRGDQVLTAGHEQLELLKQQDMSNPKLAALAREMDFIYRSTYFQTHDKRRFGLRLLGVGLLVLCILLGAELYVHAVAVVLGIGVILMLMTFVRFRNPDSYLLVVHYDDYAEQDITQLLRRTVRQRKLRSKTVTRSGAEMTVEVRLDSKQDLVSAVLNIEGVHDATLVACQVEAGT